MIYTNCRCHSRKRPRGEEIEVTVTNDSIPESVKVLWFSYDAINTGSGFILDQYYTEETEDIPYGKSKMVVMDASGQYLGVSVIYGGIYTLPIQRINQRLTVSQIMQHFP